MKIPETPEFISNLEQIFSNLDKSALTIKSYINLYYDGGFLIQIDDEIIHLEDNGAEFDEYYMEMFDKSSIIFFDSKNNYSESDLIKDLEKFNDPKFLAIKRQDIWEILNKIG